TSGQGIFTVTLNTAGIQTLTATDNNTSGVTGTITGTSGNIAVSTVVQPATHFAVTAPISATAGSPFTLTVIAEDASNATVPTYNCTVHSTSRHYTLALHDALPILTSGQGIFTVTLNTAGIQTLTATDNNTSGVTGTITGTSGNIAVSAVVQPATH